jgi:hypothetical protein
MALKNWLTIDVGESLINIDTIDSPPVEQGDSTKFRPLGNHHLPNDRGSGNTTTKDRGRNGLRVVPRRCGRLCRRGSSVTVQRGADGCTQNHDRSWLEYQHNAFPTKSTGNIAQLATGWLERREREAFGYLSEENHLLRRQLGARRLRLKDDDRRAAGGTCLPGGPSDAARDRHHRDARCAGSLAPPVGCAHVDVRDATIESARHTGRDPTIDRAPGRGEPDVGLHADARRAEEPRASRRALNDRSDLEGSGRAAGARATHVVADISPRALGRDRRRGFLHDRVLDVARVRCANRIRSRRTVFMQQAAEAVITNHRHLVRLRRRFSPGPSVRRTQVQAAMSAVSIVMVNKNRQNALEVTRTHNEQPIEALGPHRSNKSLRDSIRLWRLNRRPSDPNADRLKHVIKAAREFSIVIPDQQANRFRSLSERPRELPSLLRDPLVVGMTRAPGEMHAPARQLYEEQDIEPLQQDRVDGEEVDRDDARCVGAEEVAPRRTWARAGGPEMLRAKNLPDRRG